VDIIIIVSVEKQTLNQSIFNDYKDIGSNIQKVIEVSRSRYTEDIYLDISNTPKLSYGCNESFVIDVV